MSSLSLKKGLTMVIGKNEAEQGVQVLLRGSLTARHTERHQMETKADVRNMLLEEVFAASRSQERVVGRTHPHSLAGKQPPFS